MQNNDNQTNQKDPHNRGQNGFESISPGLCSIWLGRESLVQTFDNEIKVDIQEIRKLLDESSEDDGVGL